MDTIVLAEELPSATEYRELRAAGGWGAIEEDASAPPPETLRAEA